MSEDQPNVKNYESDIVQRSEIGIICVVRDDNSWAAYQGKEGMSFHQILAYGDKLPKNVASYLFPAIAQRYNEYRP